MAAALASGSAAASTLASSTATGDAKSPWEAPASAIGLAGGPPTAIASGCAAGCAGGEASAPATAGLATVAAGDRPASRAGADRLGLSSSGMGAEPTGSNATGGTLTGMAEPVSGVRGFAMGGGEAVPASSAVLCTSLRPVSLTSDSEAGSTACARGDPKSSAATIGSRCRGIGLLQRGAVSPSVLSVAGGESTMPGATRATMGLASGRTERSAATKIDGISPRGAENVAGTGSAP